MGEGEKREKNGYWYLYTQARYTCVQPLSDLSFSSPCWRRAYWWCVDRTACWLLRLFIKFIVIAIQLAHFLIHGNMKSPAEMLIQRYEPVWHIHTRIHQRIQVDNVMFVQLFSLSWHEQQCRAESFRQTVCLSVCMYKRPGISHNRVFLFLSLSLSVSLLTLICLNYHRRGSGASL